MARRAEMKDLNKTDDEQGGYDLIVLGGNNNAQRWGFRCKR